MFLRKIPIILSECNSQTSEIIPQSSQLNVLNLKWHTKNTTTKLRKNCTARSLQKNSPSNTLLYSPVTASFNPTRQPKIDAKSPTMAVRRPMTPSETKKHSHPPRILGGGTRAKIICGRHPQEALREEYDKYYVFKLFHMENKENNKIFHCTISSKM